MDNIRNGKWSSLTEFEVEAGRSFGRPKTHGVHAVVAISRNRAVIGHGQHNL
jgi:hypothetical protein